MKVAGRIAGVLLALLVALALVMFLWLLYPISAGVAVFLFLRTIWTNPKGKVAIFVRRFATVILLIYVLVFVVWLYYRPWSRELIAQPQSAGASTIAQAITGRSNDGAGSQDDPLAEPRRILTTRIADARFKLQEIASAIATIESAESILVSRTRTGQPDPFGLSSALEDVRSEMARVKPEGSTDSRGLLDPDVLRAVGESLTKELDEIETAQTAASQTKEGIVALQNRMPGFLSRSGVDLLPTKLVELENAVRQTLAAKLDPQTEYRVVFNRNSDTLEYRQETTLTFVGLAVKSIDLSNFFAGPHSDGTPPVHVRTDTGIDDDYPRTKLDGRAHPSVVVELGEKVTSATVTRTFLVPNASSAILNRRYLWSFRRIDVRWPEPAFPSLVVNIRLAERPDFTWPWTVDTGAPSMFAGVEIPDNSLIYSIPSGTVSQEGSHMLLAFEKLTVQALATNTPVSIEFLPWWLSWGLLQPVKGYLIVENAVSGLGVAIVTALFTAFASFAWGSGKK